MKPPHDLGGNISSPIIPDIADEPKFVEEWHRRALGLTIAVGAIGAWSIDSSRFARESLPEEDFKRYSYYEKWLGGLTTLLCSNGFISKREVIAGHADESAPSKWQDKVLRPENVAKVLRAGSPSRRSEQPLKYSIGQSVSVKRPSETIHMTPGHTRLPSYIANKAGIVIRHHGVHVLPNTNAHFLGENPENLYAVEFTGGELWGKGSSLMDTVVVDCWESYLVSSEQ